MTSDDPIRLAVSSYETVDPSVEDGEVLNLAWTRDERECLSVDLASTISLELQAEIDSELEYVSTYMVRDPYGEELLRPALAAQRPGCVSCGAGVVSLLHALARLTDDRVAHIIGDTYPDFPYWVAQLGGACTAQPSSASVAELIANLREANASLLFLERPGLTSDPFADLARLEELCRETARREALVVIDESNANYCPPEYSAVPLTSTVSNLIVARGFSKAYGLGGLRLAYCVASSSLRLRIRSALPPLLASSLSLRIGKRILELGDIAGPLRTRIRERKLAMTKLFEGAQLEQLVPSSEFLPYVFLRNSAAYLRSHLEGRGVVGKLHPIWSERGTTESLYRLSVPLNEARMDRLEQLMN